MRIEVRARPVCDASFKPVSVPLLDGLQFIGNADQFPVRVARVSPDGLRRALRIAIRALERCARALRIQAPTDGRFRAGASACGAPAAPIHLDAENANALLEV